MTREILWVDQPEHIKFWENHILCVKKGFEYGVTKLLSIEDDQIINNCQHKDATLIHCGTVRPMADLRTVLMRVKTTSPATKIGLISDVVHPLVEDLVDFYVFSCIEIDELMVILDEALSKGGSSKIEESR